MRYKWGAVMGSGRGAVGSAAAHWRRRNGAAGAPGQILLAQHRMAERPLLAQQAPSRRARGAGWQCQVAAAAAACMPAHPCWEERRS